jgi:hypothetical protein
MSPYQSRVIRQTLLWVNGRSEHNVQDNECCPDFSCCFPEMFEQDQARRVDYFTKLLRRYAAEGGPKVSPAKLG